MPNLDKETIWLLRGSQRKEVFLNLPDKEFMPNKFRKELNKILDKPVSLREISRHLKDFEKRRFVECINSDDPYNKFYRFTDKGFKAREKVKGFD